MKKETLILLPLAALFASCAGNDELQERMDKRTDAYEKFEERREIRTDARQERTDAWFDRVMH